MNGFMHNLKTINFPSLLIQMDLLKYNRFLSILYFTYRIGISFGPSEIKINLDTHHIQLVNILQLRN